MGRAVISCTEVIFSHPQTAYFRQYHMLQTSHTPDPYLYVVVRSYVTLSPLSCSTPPQSPLLHRFDYANLFTLTVTLALTTIGY